MAVKTYSAASGKALNKRKLNTDIAYESVCDNKFFRFGEAAAERLWSSKAYIPLFMLTALLFLFIDNTVLGVVMFAGLTSLMLVFSGDLLAAMLPLMLMSMLAVDHYSEFAVFLPYWWMGVVLFGALIFHIIHYGLRIKKGESLRGLIAVSAAALLGGTGVISNKDRFSALSIYYTLGIGVAMVAFYLVFRASAAEKRNYNVTERFLKILYAAGLFTGAVVITFYCHHLDEFLKNFSTIFFSYRNYCATLLLLTFPATFYFMLKSDVHILGIVFMYSSMLLTGSRSAMLFGTLTLAAGIVYLLVYNKKRRKAYIIAISLCIIPAVLFASDVIETLFATRIAEEGGFISEDDSRIKFLARSVQDFLSNPLFGIGLGNRANSDIFAGVPGSMVFYHNYIAQIFGSMGMIGGLAYALLIRDRIAILLRGFDKTLAIFAMSYVGMLFVSMTNPGEFCPYPYEMITVMIFAVAEQYKEEKAECGIRLLPERRKAMAELSSWERVS